MSDDEIIIIVNTKREKRRSRHTIKSEMKKVKKEWKAV